MVLNSFQQMGMHSQFQNYYAYNMQSAFDMQSIGLGGSAEFAGNIMSQGAAALGPGALGTASLMGLDPMSLGLTAGMLAFPKLGLVGAAGIGGATALGGGLALGAAGVAGHRMMRGAQMQLGLNRGLSQNFRFLNAQGGMGFTQNQSFQIGNDLRSLVGEMDIGGNVSTFAEISSLAQNMGRMGMASNIRTVKDFKEKFNQMLTTIKTVATELGTSLEEAQKTMASMRQVGIFDSQGQVAMAKNLRVGALAAGISSSEVSSMSKIGSQISRMVGGLGSSGAFGGAQTITQVGIAMNNGILSSEDIYNATGMTGAAGRQAFATGLMERSARFLSTGRGRWFLASVAGENGELNEEAVSEWMAGNMGTGRTRQLAHSNLAGIGRANFIRNEGRLRGAALERFGGLLQTMAYKEWLQQRGMDPTNMNDRNMLAFQRFSGLGRDEADAAIKMVENLPELLRQQNTASLDVAYSDRLRRRQELTGAVGVKKRIEQLKVKVQSSLEQAGSNLMETMADFIGEKFNQMMDVHEKVTVENLDKIVDDIWSGKTDSKHLKFLSGGKDGFSSALRDAGLDSTSSLANESSGKLDESLRNQSSLLTSYKTGLSSKDISSNINRALSDPNLRLSYQKHRALTGGADSSPIGRALASYKWAKEEGLAEGVGDDIQSKMALLGELERASGVEEDVSAGKALATDLERRRTFATGIGSLVGGAHTEAEQFRLLGKSISGSQNDSSFLAKAGAAVGFILSPHMDQALAVGGFLSGEKSFLEATKAYAGSVGSYFREGQYGRISEMVTDFLNSSTDKRIGQIALDEDVIGRKQALYGGAVEDKAAAYKRIADLKAKDPEKGSSEAIELQQLESSMAAATALEYARDNKLNLSEELTDEQIRGIEEHVRKATGNKEWTLQEGLRTVDNDKMAFAHKKAQKAVAAAEKLEARLEASKENYVNLGIGSYDEKGNLVISGSTQEALDKSITNETQRALAKKVVEDSLKMSQTQFGGTIDEKLAGLSEVKERSKSINDSISEMDAQTKSALARKFAGTPVGDAIAANISREKQLKSLVQGYRQRGLSLGAGQMAGIGAMLGVELSKDEAANLSKKDAAQASEFLLSRLDIDPSKLDSTDKEILEKIKGKTQDAIQAQREGNLGKSAQLLSEAKQDFTENMKKALMEADVAKSKNSNNPQIRTVGILQSIESKLDGISSSIKSNPEGGGEPP